MRHRCVLAVFMVASALLAPISPGVSAQGMEPERRRWVSFGAYDPEGRFPNHTLQIEQQYVSWELDQPEKTVTAVREITGKGRVPLIASESWSWEPWQDYTQANLLTDITFGRYDSTIRSLCSALAVMAPQEIWFRWGHEMELTGLFPWAQGDPAHYVFAYRHITTTCRGAGATNVKFMWSPSGDPRLNRYYPGDDVVDLIGLTVLEFREWNRVYGSDAKSFNAIFSEKYDRVKGYGKPVVIAEMGVAGDRAYQMQWLRDAYRSYESYPLLIAVVYFNQKNPANFIGFDLTPDWRLGADLFP